MLWKSNIQTKTLYIGNIDMISGRWCDSSINYSPIHSNNINIVIFVSKKEYCKSMCHRHKINSIAESSSGNIKQVYIA